MCDYQIRCPRCLGTNVKKNALNLSKTKQQYKCRACGRKFVDAGSDWFISEQEKTLIRRLLLERISLRGICRVMGISMKWLMAFLGQVYRELPEDLHLKLPPLTKVRQGERFYIKLMDNEADELWSFVGRRKRVHYVWVVMHRQSRQVVAFHVGDRSRQTARQLWEKVPERVRRYGLFHTDDWESYKTVIPLGQHLYSKQKKHTNHLERFNNTLRQRVSRLVRETLSFSKKLENHIAAIKYFICHYNLERQKITAP